MASTLPNFRTQLRTLLLADGVIGAANVKVYKYLTPNAEGEAWIEFTRAILTHTYQSMDTRKEMFDLRVNVWHLAPGKGDAKATIAETNVLAWADAIQAVIKADKTIGGSVDHCAWLAGQVDNQLNDSGRWALYEGHIEVTAFGV